MLQSVLRCALVLALVFAAPPLRAQNAAEAPEHVDIDARLALDAYEALVETELESMLHSLRVLARTAEVRSGDWDQARTVLAPFSQEAPLAAAIWMARPDGAYFTVERGAQSETLADRPYFPLLLAGEDVEGQLVVSRSTGAKAVIVATPVLADDGSVAGALGVSVSAEMLSEFVETRVGFPDHIVFYALDGEGQAAFHRQTALTFAFPAELESPSLREAVAVMLSQPDGVVRYTFRGEDKVVVFSRSETTGWVFALGIEQAASD